MKYHCTKFHNDSILWPIALNDHKVQGDQVSVLLFAQKLMPAASKKVNVTNILDFEVYFATVFGIAIGMIRQHSGITSFGTTQMERITFSRRLKLV